MTESLLESAADGSQMAQEAQVPPVETQASQRPSGVPEKFWDKEQGELRTEALLKSYVELERKLGKSDENGPPESPEDYHVNSDNDLLASDAEINKRLHAAGFSQKQAQLVYDLAAERLPPLVAEVASMFEAETQLGYLKKHFGGEERWRETARQIEAWGRSRLPSPVFDALSTTHDGVLAIHRMMVGDEPGLLNQGMVADRNPTEGKLKEMMRDPKYWRDQDPEFVEKVRRGFRNIYGEEG